MAREPGPEAGGEVRATDVAAREATADEEAREAALVRHEEELRVGKRTTEIGRARARKVVETRPVEEWVERAVEHVEVERTAGGSEDEGRVEMLPDGSISVPVFAEELEVRKRLVVKERIRIGKRTVQERERIATELRSERVEIEADPGVEVETVEKGEDEMAITDHEQRAGTRARPSARGWLDTPDSGETKPFFLTSEFLTLLAAVAAVAIAMAASDVLDANRGWLLITALAVAYILSRGIAKAGTRYAGRD